MGAERQPHARHALLQALDGKGGAASRREITITPSIGKARISALAIDEKGGRLWFATAEANGFIGLEFLSPQRVVGLRFTGVDKGAFVGGKVQVSTVGRDGPWTDAGKIEAEPK